ncbi:MAG: hypothetical protein II534_08985 [Clostridia bacterium]|nr:hypothetical protein [Clostridia bacterium]
MAIKMRYLYFSGKKKIASIGPYIKAKYDLPINSVDVIPPAYSCDKERIVILGLSLKKEIPDQLRLFCREMTKARAVNTALIVDGDPAAANAVRDTLKEAGTNVVGETLFIKGGMPIFGGNLSDEEKKAVDVWIEGVVSSLS